MERDSWDICSYRRLTMAVAAGTVALLTWLASTASSQASSRPGDNGPAKRAIIDGPFKLAFDSDGNLFVYESSDDRPDAIRKIAAVTQTITTVAAGCGFDPKAPSNACFRPLTQLMSDQSGGLLLVEFLDNRLRQYDLRAHKFATVAGKGERDFSGDGGPATQAGILSPNCATTDKLGNIFVCDSSGRIRRIDGKTGVISTVAGTGREGFGGDHGPAVLAEFTLPLSLAVDSAGNLYVADNGDTRIRRIDSQTGIIEAIAGSGRFRPERGSSLSDYPGFKGEGGPALDADLSDIEDLNFDPNGDLLFINDGTRVCRISLNSGKISTVAGIGQRGFSGDGGPATLARFFAFGMALDRLGNIFIADWQYNRIRRVDATTGIITTIAGNGNPRRGPFVTQ